MTEALTAEVMAFFEIIRKTSLVATKFSFAFIETELANLANPFHVELVSQPGTVTAQLGTMKHVVYSSNCFHLFSIPPKPTDYRQERFVIEYNSCGVNLSTEAFAELADALVCKRLHILFPDHGNNW